MRRRPRGYRSVTRLSVCGERTIALLVRACGITLTGRLNEIVVTGLDPVIHLLRKSFSRRRRRDARIKSGHDQRVFAAHVKKCCALQFPIQFSNSLSTSLRGGLATKQSILPRKERMDCFAALAMTSKDTFAPRDAMRPSCAFIFRPPRRAWGMPDACCTRGLVCNCSDRTHTSNNEHTGITRHSRTQWFYGLCRALPGDRALLPPSSADMFCLSPVGPT
jgi:hypothetical protein